MAHQMELVAIEVIVDMHESEDIASGYVCVHWGDGSLPEVYVMPRRTCLLIQDLCNARPAVIAFKLPKDDSWLDSKLDGENAPE